MSLNLPDTISSPQDLKVLILNVQSYANWFQHESIKMSMNSSHAPKPPLMDPSSVDLIRNWAGNQQLDQRKLDALINELQAYKEKAPVLTITLAAPAPGDLRAALISWCRKNISPECLITFKFNATILGGMIVRFGSHVYDWSFKRQILANREKFPEALRNA